MPHTTINGTDIFYTDTGNTGKTPVILLHSSAASARQWAVLSHQLAGDYRLIAPDLIGYGQSGPFPGGDKLTLSDEAHMVHAMLDMLDEPAHLIGHSYGGAVALHTALEAPERVRSLGLYEPVSFFVLGKDDPALHEIQGVARHVEDSIDKGDNETGMSGFVDYWNGPGTWDAIRPVTRAALAAVTPKLIHDFFAIMTEPDSHDALSKLAIPTTIFCGSDTRIPARAVAETLAGLMPEARLEMIEGAAHMSPVMQPDLVNPHIVAHLQRNHTKA